MLCLANANDIAFLSTLSLRRATDLNANRHRLHAYFYPRSPCGERPVLALGIPTSVSFLSTLSLRRATVHIAEHASPGGISIHALLAESDTNDRSHGSGI